MIRLALRLSAAGGRWTLIPTALAAIAVGLGTTVLLFALAFQPALGVRYDHGAWRSTAGVTDPADAPPNATLVSLTHEFVGGRPLDRVDLAGLSATSPVPPGLPRLPRPGEAFVSPGVADLLSSMPADQIANRFGTVVGVIDDIGLQAPNELVVAEGTSAETLRAAGSRAVTAFDTRGQIPSFDFIINIIVAVAVVGAIAPVAVFVATATRLAAARRERRLVALRLCGATPAQVSVLAAVDALLIAGPGALLGVILFFVLRPTVAQIPLAQLTWFPDAIVPPVAPAIALVLAVPFVGIVASVISLRRMAISPLGVARRVPSGSPRARRVVPVVIASAAYVGALVLGQSVLGDAALIAVSLSFFGIIVGIAIAGPWLTAVTGRVLASRGGTVRLLAGRRLLDDPGASFRAVAGVVMAVFVASVFFGFVAFTNRVSGAARVPVRSSSVYAEIPGGIGGTAEGVVPGIRAISGVSDVVLVRPVVLRDAKTGAERGKAWIAPCEALIEAADFVDAACGSARAYAIRSAPDLAGPIVASGYPLTATESDLSGPPTAEASVTPQAVTERLMPATAATDRQLPDVLLDPSLVANGGQTIRPLFVLVGTNGDPSVIERVRTALEAALPMSGPTTGAELGMIVTKVFDELGRVVSLGVVLVLLVAGCSLAVAVAGGLLDRRRPFALLRMSGLTLADLRRVLVVEAAAPLLTIAVVSAALGIAVSQLVLRTVATGAVPLPDPSLAVLLAGSIAGAMAVVACVLPIVGPVTELEETRFE